MDKLLRRTQRATRDAAKKAKEFKTGEERAEVRQFKQELRRQQANIGRNIKEARRNRRIDWETGSLAPRRDVGENAETYGTISIYDVHPPKLPPKQRLDWWPVDIGDRVVVTKGPDRGKIGSIIRKSKDHDTVEISGVNEKDVFIPVWMRQEDNDHTPIDKHACPVPVQHLKLVYPLPDPETGVLKDVVVDRVERMPGTKADRLIPGSNIIIRAQPQAEESEEDEEAYPADTTAASVNDETFNPMLLYPPMPSSVIDELRNKYSAFRTRHDHEYLEKKREEDEREEARKGLGKTMRTPLQELAELRAQQKEAQRRELTDEQLEKIGAIMAQEKGRTRLARQSSAIPPSAANEAPAETPV